MPVPGPQFTTLEAALDRLGPAWVLVGDMLTAGGLSVLGLIEGSPGVAMNPQFVERTYERTGDTPWDVKILGYKPQIDLALIDGDESIYAKVAPGAAAKGGHTSPQDVTYTSLVLVPESEFAGGLEFNQGGVPPAWVKPVGGTKHAVWIPRGYFTGTWPAFAPTSEGVSKATTPVTFHGVISRDAAFPEGAKSWIIGDPYAAGVTDLSI